MFENKCECETKNQEFCNYSWSFTISMIIIENNCRHVLTIPFVLMYEWKFSVSSATHFLWYNNIQCIKYNVTKWKFSLFRYEIKTNPNFLSTPSTEELFGLESNCRETIENWSEIFPIENGFSCPANRYYYSSFVALQSLLDYTSIRVSLGILSCGCII